jgi:hypothetical protein
MQISEAIYARYQKMIDTGKSDIQVRRFVARWDVRERRKGREHRLSFNISARRSLPGSRETI